MGRGGLLSVVPISPLPVLCAQSLAGESPWSAPRHHAGLDCFADMWDIEIAYFRHQRIIYQIIKSSGFFWMSRGCPAAKFSLGTCHRPMAAGGDLPLFSALKSAAERLQGSEDGKNDLNSCRHVAESLLELYLSIPGSCPPPSVIIPEIINRLLALVKAPKLGTGQNSAPILSLLLLNTLARALLQLNIQVPNLNPGLQSLVEIVRGHIQPIVNGILAHWLDSVHAHAIEALGRMAELQGGLGNILRDQLSTASAAELRMHLINPAKAKKGEVCPL
eukprot:1325759-Amorphochlora_amoeboformis.AAC.2